MADVRVIHAYRHLYRGLLHAVQFSKPARYVARDRLRAGFRAGNEVLDPRAIARTLRFLDAAARERGLEHAVLKNLLMTEYFRRPRKTWKLVQMEDSAKESRAEFQDHIQDTAYKHYDMTVAMLNKSLGLCLR